jgi:hypothetical protein
MDCDRPWILILMCEIVRDQLEYSKQVDRKDALAKETINVMEALCWNMPERLVGKCVPPHFLLCHRVVNDSLRLAVIPCSREVVSILLHNSQPSWLLARSARLLATLATRMSLPFVGSC